MSRDSRSVAERVRRQVEQGLEPTPWHAVLKCGRGNNDRVFLHGIIILNALLSPRGKRQVLGLPRSCPLLG